MNQEFFKLNRFDGQNYTRWADKVKFMLHVLKLAYVLDPKPTPIPVDPIPEVGKTVDPMSDELRVGHIKNSLSDRLYDLYESVKDLRELWSVWNSSKRHMRKVLITVCSTSSATEGCRGGPQTSDIFASKKQTSPKYLEFQMTDDKPIMEQVHELQVMVTKLNTLSISIQDLFQVGVIIAKLSPS
uniref:Uncharacterized protein n=1 Tax=Lactuca sativa TaxID=4236 RepID=A0A9R1VQB6_LACSA|nr:hypothetical protein LSAT_V11C400180890 [Lactuca sativa]